MLLVLQPGRHLQVHGYKCNTAHAALVVCIRFSFEVNKGEKKELAALKKKKKVCPVRYFLIKCLWDARWTVLVNIPNT